MAPRKKKKSKYVIALEELGGMAQTSAIASKVREMTGNTGLTDRQAGESLYRLAKSGRIKNPMKGVYQKLNYNRKTPNFMKDKGSS